METINHEGKTYSRHPATKLCIGCDFWKEFNKHTECHAPADAQCLESIYKEVLEVEQVQSMDGLDRYDFEYQFMTREDSVTILKFILSVIFIIALTIGFLVATAYIIINNYN